MKTKLKRMLCVMLTLCMMFGMMPGTVVTADAAAEDYSVYFNYDSSNGLPSVSYVETAKDLYLNTNNINDEAYDIHFTLGQGPMSVFDEFDDQTGLFTKVNDPNTNKVTGISLNGAAISSICNNGSFEIKTEVVINEDIVYTFVQSVMLEKNRYPLSFIWNQEGPVRVYEDATVAELELDTSSLSKLPDYDIDYVLGTMVSDSFVSFETQTGLFTKVIDSSTQKVTGIILNGAAIRQVFSDQGFIVRADIKIDDYAVDKQYLSVQLMPPNYSVSFSDRRPQVSNRETAKEFLLDTSNIMNKNYDIEFTLGQGLLSNFSPFADQTGLFTKVIDTNTNKVTGISLNGAAISSVLQGNSFDIKTEVKINGESKYVFVNSANLDRQYYSVPILANGNGLVGIFEDATAAVLELDTSELNDLAEYDIDFELGIMGPNGPSGYTPFSTQTGLFTKVIDSNTNKVTGISFNAVAIRQVCSDSEFVVKVDTKIDGYTISTNHWSVQLFSTDPRYSYYYGDENMLPGGGMGIDPQIEYYIENSQYPNGFSGWVDVTDVSVQINNGASDVVQVVYDGEMWNILCSGLGEADITVTHKTPDGGTMDYTYTLSVVDSIWTSSYWNKDGVQNAVQGGSIGVDLEIQNTRWAPGKGQYAVDTPYEVEWYVVRQEQAPYLNFVYNNADKTDVTVEVASNAPEEDYDIGYAVYELDANGNRVADSDGNVYPVCGSDWVRLIVMNEFPKLYLAGYDRNLEVGETMTVTPSMIRVYLDNGVEKEEVINGATFGYWNNQSDDIEIVEKNGTFEVTRLASWEIWDCGIEAEFVFQGDNWRTGQDMYFTGLDYSISYKALRGQDETTWMYDNEDYTLEVDMTNLTGKRANITLDWLVIEWLDEENYEELNTGYTVNGNKITLKGKELAAMGLEAFSVVALVESNGYITDGAAYADVELVKAPIADKIDTTKPVTTVTPVIDQAATDVAVKEAMTVVDAIDAAISDAEITVDAEGKIDKLPAALEGVVAKETVEAIIKAKENGDVITVEIVTETITRDQAVTEAAADVAKIEAAIPGNGKVAQFLDLSVIIKSVDSDGTETALGTLNQLKEEKMTFAIALPKNLNAAGKNFYVLRAHDGVVDKLPATKNADGTISFTTDRYSTYALVYEEIDEEEVDEEEDDNSDDSSIDTQQNTTTHVTSTSPATGDDANVTLWLLLAISMICVAIALQSKKNRIC